MVDALKSFTETLDQFYLLFKTFPPPFKIWVYLLIFLIFLTLAAAAVFYLLHKERLSLQYFSVEAPHDNQIIPLGESPTWLIHGRFPIVEDPALGRTASIEIEVLRLPERHPIEQTGKSRISTVEGVWTFEFARFPVEGPYEIIASGFLSGTSVFRRIRVTCEGRAAAIASIVKRDSELRGVDFEPKSMREIDITTTKAKLYGAQEDFFREIRSDLAASKLIVDEALQLANHALVIFPDDPELQTLRAYYLKNYAMVMSRSGRPEESDRALNEAGTMFQALLQQNPRDAAAWNGLGSVALLKDEPKRALYYINRALEISPAYEAAIHDRELALERLGSQSTRQ